jgi:hypothetical protein
VTAGTIQDARALLLAEEFERTSFGILMDKLLAPVEASNR